MVLICLDAHLWVDFSDTNQFSIILTVEIVIFLDQRQGHSSQRRRCLAVSRGGPGGAGSAGVARQGITRPTGHPCGTRLAGEKVLGF